MCLHATWLDPKRCIRCTPLRKRGFSTTSLGIEKTSSIRRISEIPVRKVAGPQLGPKPRVEATCVGCGLTVNPSFCYRGSVLSDLVHSTLKGSTTTPILGVATITSYVPPVVGDKHVVLGGHTIETARKIAFRKRTKGLICDRCAANYTYVDDGKGGKVPVVETSAKGDYTDSLNTGDVKTFKKGAAFNTRYTQGRRGRRV